MPYTTQEKRKKLDPIIDRFPPLDDGEFNYTVTRISHRFIIKRGLRYLTLVRVIGGLICVVLELYRLVAARYEDKKKEENGFISELDRITKDEKQAIWKCKICGEIFKDNEVQEVIGHETYYQCPNRDCNADSKNWEQIRAAID